MLDKCIKLGGMVAGPLGRGTNRYASNGALRIAYEVHGAMHRRRPWLVLIQGMGFTVPAGIRCCRLCGAVSGSS